MKSTTFLILLLRVHLPPSIFLLTKQVSIHSRTLSTRTKSSAKRHYSIKQSIPFPNPLNPSFFSSPFSTLILYTLYIYSIHILYTYTLYIYFICIFYTHSLCIYFLCFPLYFTLLFSTRSAKKLITSSYDPKIITAFGITLSRCAVSPPYSPQSPSSFHTTWKHCTSPLYLPFPLSLGACRSRVLITYIL